MSQQRWVRLSTEKLTSTIYILGTELSLDVCGSAPAGATTFLVYKTLGVNCVVHETNFPKSPSQVSRWPLHAGMEVIVTMNKSSWKVDDGKLQPEFQQVKDAGINEYQ